MDRKAFKESAKQKIDALDSKIDELEAKQGQYKEEAKAAYHEGLAKLKAKKADMELKYKELQDSSDQKWEEAKTIFSDAADSFEEGFKKLGSIFK